MEWRIQAGIQPMQLNIDQLVVAFLQHFFATSNSGAWEVVGGDLPTLGDEVQGTSSVFVQRCQIDAFALTINYKPRSIDMSALRSGSVAELLNLVPWGATLQFRRLRLYAMEGLGALGELLRSAALVASSLSNLDNLRVQWRRGCGRRHVDRRHRAAPAPRVCQRHRAHTLHLPRGICSRAACGAAVAVPEHHQSQGLSAAAAARGDDSGPSSCR